MDYHRHAVKWREGINLPQTFSRASRQLHVFASSLIGSLNCLCPCVIGQSDYFGFGFTKLNRKTPLLKTMLSRDDFPIFSELFIPENDTLYTDYNILFVIYVSLFQW